MTAAWLTKRLQDAAKKKEVPQEVVVTPVVTDKVVVTRSADRHKGSRAAYMRAYRASK